MDGPTEHRGAAKATDENLTSENWEYILVCGAGKDNLGALASAYVLCRMFATRSKAAMQGMDSDTAFDAVGRIGADDDDVTPCTGRRMLWPL